MQTDILLIAVAVLAGSAVGTGLMRSYAVRREVLDLPNGRSSHDRAVPLGGGIALSCAALAGLAAAVVVNAVDWRLALALGAGGLVLAIVGWLDDRHTLSPVLRAVVQTGVALVAVLLVGGLPSVDIGRWTLYLGHAGIPLAVLGVVWVANLYNFMDGIDGIAGGQGAAAGLLGAALVWWLGAAHIAAAPLLLGAAALGFLVWNWAPARIFMGDAGSVTLGFGFAVTAIASENAGALPLLGWAALLGIFLVDATVTLLRRMARGEDWTAPHRLHAYQRLVQSGLSHSTVAGGTMLYTIIAAAAFWLTWSMSWGFEAVLLALTALPLGLYWIAERRLAMGHGHIPDEVVDHPATDFTPLADRR
jgi:Fuc2NAc and GlcNAc transferase